MNDKFGNVQQGDIKDNKTYAPLSQETGSEPAQTEVAPAPSSGGGQGLGNTIRKIREKPLVLFGSICFALSAAYFLFYISTFVEVDKSEAASEAIRDGMSSKLPLGVLLYSEDESLDFGDHTITHNIKGQNSTKIWVWDFAAEDGDYVEILANGLSLGSAFMIKNKPVMITVPLPGLAGTIQVKGVRDGGGGITYAVHFELVSRTYFNAAGVGENNTYTLRPN
jgi:hypothetical protein